MATFDQALEQGEIVTRRTFGGMGIAMHGLSPAPVFADIARGELGLRGCLRCRQRTPERGESYRNRSASRAASHGDDPADRERQIETETGKPVAVQAADESLEGPCERPVGGMGNGGLAPGTSMHQLLFPAVVERHLAL